MALAVIASAPAAVASLPCCSERWQQHIIDASREFDVDRSLVAATIHAESACDTRVDRGDHGEVGPAQITDVAAEDLYRLELVEDVDRETRDGSARAAAAFLMLSERRTECEGTEFTASAWNGGHSHINRESRIAGSCRWSDVEKVSTPRRSEKMHEINRQHVERVMRLKGRYEQCLQESVRR